MAKKLASLEKERREQEKEKAKALKEKQKQEEARRKEHTRAVVKSIKEKHRKSDKLRQQFKKDVVAESKKNKTDASAVVLQYFDEEEEMEEHAEQLAATSQSLALSTESAAVIAGAGGSVREFVSSLPTLDEQFNLVSSFGAPAAASDAASKEDLNLSPVHTSVDEVMQISTTLHLFRKHLNIESSVSLDNLINSIVSVSSTTSGSAVVEDDSIGGGSSAVEVEETVAVSTNVKEETVEDGASSVMAVSEVKSMGDDENVKEDEQLMEVVSENKSDNGHAMSTTTDHASVGAAAADDDAKEVEGSAMAADEAEWDEAPESVSKDGASANAAASSSITATTSAAPVVDPKNQSSLVIPEAEMDKIQLKLMKGLLGELHHVLDLDTGVEGESVRLPLNQLTWQELARMAIVSHIYSELGKTKDDAQHAVRGGKHPNFKTAKNIVRNIRYKMYLNSMSGVGKAEADNAADNEEQQASAEELKWLDQICRYHYYQAGADRKPSSNEFNNETEMLNSLEFMSNNASQYSEAYRRCARVMIKILNMSASKNLIWEVDSEMYPDYYSTISRPIMFSNIATNLVNRTYTEEEEDLQSIDGVDTEKMVSLLFYQDMMQVVINCFTYNTEVTLVVSQAYKVLCAIRRYVQVWIVSSTRPPVEACDEKVCLLTGTPIFANVPGSILKCGKCTGAFSCETILQRCSTEAEKNPFLVKPSNTVIDQTNEEWVCSFCLRDAFTSGKDQQSLLKSSGQSPFVIDEWGPSGLLPWMLNGHHSAKIEDFRANVPHLLPLFNALRILTRSDISSVCDRTEAVVVCGTCIEPEGQASASTRKCSRWSFADRVTVLGALCRVLRVSDKSLEVMSKIYTDCEKLMRIGNKPNFREADFMEMVKELSGEEGVTLCRSLLDGIDSSESYLQNIISEGRCVVCNGSTLEEDMAANAEEEGEVEDIILCDGCNAEVHLSCLGLSVVSTFGFSLLSILIFKF